MTESTTWKRLGSAAAWLARRYAQSGVPQDQAVVRCMGQLVALRPAMTPARHPVNRDAALLGWVRSGALTWGEAEALYVLDATTAWR
jgi:hypothetical protein